ncbi:MAG: hypothetical protein AB7S71_05810 [Dongiaceae bacterium]
MILPAALFALLLGVFVFGVLPRAGLAQRALSAALFVLLVAVVYGGGIELLGRPKPLRLEWRDAVEARVLGAVPVENEAIYLWLDLPGSAAPRAYVLPWSLQAAQQLQAAASQAEASGTAVRMTMPPDGEAGLDDREPMFYAMPQPALPAKDYDAAAPLVFPQPGRSS